MRSIQSAVFLALAVSFAFGCASAYDQTYQREMGRLEGEQQARDEQERAAHSEARRYAAVVYFEVGSSVIKEEGYREIDWFLQQLQPYPKAIIEVRGFADATGGDAVNQELSSERAVNVARYIASRGIDKARIDPLGFASEFAVGSNETAKGRKSNRRVELTVR